MVLRTMWEKVSKEIRMKECECGVPDARLPAQVPHLEFDVFELEHLSISRKLERFFWEHILEPFPH